MNRIILLLSAFILTEHSLSAARKEVTVGPEDTVYGIAYNNGITTRSLISANSLKAPYVLRQGQVLVVPSANEHIVARGEDLRSIAEDYAVNFDVLAQENNIQPPYFIKEGDSLLIPSRDTVPMAQAFKPQEQMVTTSSLEPLPLVKSKQPTKETHDGSKPLAIVAPTGPAPIGLPQDVAAEIASEKGLSKPQMMGNLASSKEKKEEKKTKPVVTTAAKKEEEKVEKKIAKTEPKPEEKKVVEEKSIQFIWPLQGKVISKFGKSTKNDGINIKGNDGALIKAAASGEIMYSGNELKGFGNLLLIKHEGGWITAYGHNSELLVKKGDKVKQGQTIAKCGKTGDVKEPQLHFELRKGKQPIDPEPKLGQ